MKELFKVVCHYPDYEISNCGRVKTKSRSVRYTHSVTRKEHFRKTKERFLKVYLNNRTGYKFVQLYNNGKAKNYNIHRLVAENFISNELMLDVVNHIDGNKHNNRFDNLEWCTNKYNHEHAVKTGLIAKGEKVSSSKLNRTGVLAIKNLIKKSWKDSDIAFIFGVSRSTITLIRLGKTWKHITLTGEELTYTP